MPIAVVAHGFEQMTHRNCRTALRHRQSSHGTSKNCGRFRNGALRGSFWIEAKLVRSDTLAQSIIVQGVEPVLASILLSEPEAAIH